MSDHTQATNEGGQTRRRLLGTTAAALGAAGATACASGGAGTAGTAFAAVRATVTRVDLGSAKYHTKGDGRDDTTALLAWRRDILAAVAEGASGVRAIVPSGVFALGRGHVLDILSDRVHLEGDGVGGSILTQVNGNGRDVVTTHGGIARSGFSVSNLTIDGNGQHQKRPGWCLNVHGFDYDIDNVNLLHGSAGGLRSHWVDDGKTNVFEARIRGLGCRDYTGIAGSKSPAYGILWAGPHDSQFSDIVLSTLLAAQYNTGSSYGFVQVDPAAGEYISNMHVWGRHHYGIWADPNAWGIHLANVVAEGAFLANAVLPTSSTWSGGEVYGTLGNGGKQPDEVGISLGIAANAPDRPPAEGITNGFGCESTSIQGVRAYKFTSPGSCIDLSNSGGGNMILMPCVPHDQNAATLSRGKPAATDWVQLMTPTGARLVQTLT